MPALTSQEAVLIMESNGFAPAVRSTGFSQQWSRLYQAGPFFIDMTLKPTGNGSLLQGQVLHQDGEALPANSAVWLRRGAENARAPLGAAGDFSFAIDTASVHALGAELASDTFMVTDLAIS